MNPVKQEEFEEVCNEVYLTLLGTVKANLPSKIRQTLTGLVDNPEFYNPRSKVEGKFMSDKTIHHIETMISITYEINIAESTIRAIIEKVRLKNEK